MSVIATQVPINSQGQCPDPSAIVSTVKALDLIVYELVPASSDDDIGSWHFELFLTNKAGGGTLNLSLGLGLGRYLSALVLTSLSEGTYNVNLKVRNYLNGTEVLIDPIIVRKPG
ncbi:hypothetical protein SAMN04488038_11494 [Solimonas aquatica]|uniref:Uncharacterized protein n=1 Tax=Solimonas aquatica TaxID=489703 RepID=A0A1H9KYI3_9GAMM|nr:hypothetical protein [Solimonas aquatica]SER04128.1 hypothetical protein SAMN04488038_11494 [Solimonas aquatica]